jgi:glycerophosphoryl diester phosphodiesterase
MIILMKQQWIGILLVGLGLFSCQNNGMKKTAFDVQGHRGCRGLLPENAIPAFVRALELGVTTLEMDVVITKDKQVLVSHEPWMSNEICIGLNGDSLVNDVMNTHNIYKMNFKEVLMYDCGSLPHPRFPEQVKMKVHKPLLKDVIATIEKLIQEKDLEQVQYNIEIKSAVEGDDIFHPQPKEFVDLVYAVIEGGNVKNRTIIQSFDPRPLNYLNDKDASIQTAYLTENQLGFQHNLSRLDFKPTIFSPDKIFVTPEMIEFFHGEDIKVIPWTVNDTTEMQNLINLGVDGIITDYPDRLIKILSK